MIKFFFKSLAVVTAIGIPLSVLLYSYAIQPEAKPAVQEVHVTIQVTR